MRVKKDVAHCIRIYNKLYKRKNYVEENLHDLFHISNI